MARSLFGAMGLLAAVLAAGCGQPADVAKAGKAEKTVKGRSQDGHAHGANEDDDHSGWWCNAHGIPEAECSMCDKKVFNEYLAKGELCEKHPNRAKSQCFICNPALKEEFAKRYRAKEGKEPPEPKGQREKPTDKK